MHIHVRPDEHMIRSKLRKQRRVFNPCTTCFGGFALFGAWAPAVALGGYCDLRISSPFFLRTGRCLIGQSQESR